MKVHRNSKAHGDRLALRASGCANAKLILSVVVGDLGIHIPECVGRIGLRPPFSNLLD